MTDRILFVEDSDAVRTSVAQMLARRFEVRSVRDAEEAVSVFDREGPFPLIVSDYGLPGMDGIAFLGAVHRHVPETFGILLTGVADLDLAVDALREPGVHQLLRKPCGFEALVQSIESGLAHYRDRCARQDDYLELEFKSESLAGFTGLLEERLSAHAGALHCLHGFALELCAAVSLEEIVQCAARAAHGALQRGVLVQVWDEQGGRSIEAAAGPEMSSRLLNEPLSTHDGRIGAIVVDLEGPRGARLTEVEQSLLSSIAASTAVASHHEFRRRDLERAQHATIRALARLAEQRDNETGLHLQRLAAYCRLLAVGLRDGGLYRATLTDDWIRNLELSSALHDIGKVGIPDSILLKPGQLNPDEWEIMKSHARLGGETLDGVIEEAGPTRFLVMGRDIAWAHHEKWDGSGYPRGLAGERIPLAARILALADVYDALTTERPYKSAWPHDRALAWITERSGSHFDPDVVAAFLACERAADGIRGRWADRVNDLPVA